MKRGKLRKQLAVARDNARDSFWFVPAVLTLLTSLLAGLTLWVDKNLRQDLGDDVSWLFGGTAEGAWTLLQVIAGSLITVISVAFSVTLIAIQQASTHFSPRLLRNFTSDRSNQVVLGTYVATFIYALLVLREVREKTDTSAAFVPALSLFVAIALAVISLAMLIYYIHHITESLQLPYLLAQIRSELDAELERQFPNAFGEESADAPRATTLIAQAREHESDKSHTVCSREEGYLKRVDEKALQEALRQLSDRQALRLAEVPVQIGRYLRRGSVLLRAWTADEIPESVQHEIQNAFDFGGHRSVPQDPLFGIEQMVDVAVKALSPSVNDPTTATQALDQTAAALSLLQGREIPSPARRFAPDACCVFEVPGYADFVEASFGRIRRAASGDAGVQMHLVGLLEDLAQSCPSPARARALRHQAAELLLMVEQSKASAHDKDLLRRCTARVLGLLDRLSPA